MKVRKFAKTSVMTAIVAGLGFSALAHADTYDQRYDESKARHDVMVPFGKGFSRITKIRKGEEGSPADFPEIAAAMADAASKAKAIFKTDTRGKEGFTKSKDSIWENWDDFAARLDQLEVDAKAFAVAAKTGDMSKMGPAMGAVGKNCKSCHDKYKTD